MAFCLLLKAKRMCLAAPFDKWNQNKYHEVHNAYAKLSPPGCHYPISWESERVVGGEVTSFAIWVKKFKAGILI